jgi:hypothetical protein
VSHGSRRQLGPRKVLQIERRALCEFPIAPSR